MIYVTGFIDGKEIHLNWSDHLPVKDNYGMGTC
jgi:hypothetical protein